MADSERPNREMIHAQSTGYKKLLPSGLHLIAVACDNNNKKPIMDITPGEPYIAFIGVTAVGILLHQATFPNHADRKDVVRSKEVIIGMVKAQPCDEGTSTFDHFESSKNDGDGD